MESRQVTLLTRGYLLGWLTFDYHHPLSKLREKFILREVEKDLYKEIVALRGQVDASLLGTIAARNKQAFDVPYAAIQSYSELALPYIYKKDKIEEVVSTDNADYWTTFLEEKQKQLDEENKLKQQKIE